MLKKVGQMKFFKEKNPINILPSVLNKIKYVKHTYNEGKFITNKIISDISLGQKTAIVFNVAKWKRKYLTTFLPEYRLIFMKNDVNPEILEGLIKVFKNVEFIIWGRNVPLYLESIATKKDIKINHIEDGFIRSVGLGSNHIPAYSLCFDTQGIYYDSTQPSDLESILSSYDFINDNNLIEKSKRLIKELVENKISKYNLSEKIDVKRLYGIKAKKRILVIGQVEDDQSLIYGCTNIMTNAEMLEKVILENQNCQIIYKPHPDILELRRKELSKFTSIENQVEILDINIPLADALYEVDRVYTMTSLAGFEALLHGIPVTTFGAPFYSNWGVTDDRQKVERRNRNLKIEEIFAAAYILYPRYISKDYLSVSNIEQTLINLKEDLDLNIEQEYSNISNEVNFYNFQTKHPVNYNYINKSVSHKKLILSANANLNKIVHRIHSNNVDILFLSEKLSNNSSYYYSPDYHKFNMGSVIKKYFAPFSDMEFKCTKDSKIFSELLCKKLEVISDDLIPLAILKELSSGIEDYLYNDILKFHTYNDILDEYDQIYLDCFSYEEDADCINSLIYHATQKDVLPKLNISFQSNNESKQFVKKNNILHNELQDFEPLLDNIHFKTIYWSIQQNFKDYSGNSTIVCGSILGGNYAYSPSTLKVLNTLKSNNSNEVIYLNSNLSSNFTLEEIKKCTFDESLFDSVKIYNGNILKYRKKYKNDFSDFENFILNEFYQSYISELMLHLPEQFILILKNRVVSFLKSLLSQLVMIIEFTKILEKSELFITTMERSSVSRSICALAQAYGIRTVGIQPQVISTSPRYKKFLVDKMGVIDSKQAEIFKKLGSSNEIVQIGSVNIINRLQILEEQHELNSYKKREFTVFFAMQHSLQEEMAFISKALLNLSKKMNVKIYIKPHPHQEKSVINMIDDLFIGANSIEILKPLSDTYEYISKSDVVLGVFSSVLLESGIFGKPVIVMHKNSINNSINYAKLGLAVETSCENNLFDLLCDFKIKGEIFIKLKKSQNQYLLNNLHFQKPYNFHSIENFIKDSLY